MPRDDTGPDAARAGASDQHRPGPPPAGAVSDRLPLLLGASGGALVANIYFAQPLIAPIGRDIGLSPATASLIVTLTQLGYAGGLLLLVPLGDRLDSRRLVPGTVLGTAAAAALAALAPGEAVFLLASLLLGLFAASAQMLVPIAARNAGEAVRGRAVGNVVSGILIGILLARPVASLVTDLAGWRVVFGLSAAAMLGIAALLRRGLPPHRPVAQGSYAALLLSLVRLFRHSAVLRRRAFYQALLFASFIMFWTAVPLMLADLGLSQRGIALFALAGAAGAVAAPVAGRLADRGWTQPGSAAAMLAVLAGFGLMGLGGDSIPVLVAAALLVDIGVTGNLVLGQRVILSLGAAQASRMNGLYMATIFVGGASGGALAGLMHTLGGAAPVAWAGIALALVALLAFAIEFLSRPSRVA
ncbi:MFS transporter [Roseomonas sp. NAR14]|uniref:MFS transporter n=1 Tax=Roseomonas acroporae TaxID=2937791 RepID=A0A9X1Y4V9_9PROT|nr:MFS transporter [Roseomonas acroporae]MCK8783115.1 MFS transporter [Roseomonas acroporae]